MDCMQDYQSTQPQDQRGGINDMYHAKMQAAAATNQLRDRPKRSPIEEAIERLATVVEGTRQDLNELHDRLAPVSQPVPIDPKAQITGGRPPATCTVEGRISDIAECVMAIASDLRAARDGLCI